MDAGTVDIMQLEENDIQEFVQLWREEFKETLSPADARHCASLLLELYGVLARPLPELHRVSSDDESASIEDLSCDTSSTAGNPAKTKTAK